MAVPEQTPYSEHTGNGITKSFALNFDCESKDHLIVLVDEIEPPIATWSLSGGNVEFTTAPASGSKITIQRNTPFSRSVDYQSYNNSFRPQSVNGDFDRLWLKLQELGVADWILSMRIDALKNYVDRKDDELKAYLMEEIRKQGVALDQLDDYYNYLMQRLAQIAVDKGWDASFVVDGTQTQKEINLYGGKKYDMPAGGYQVGQIVILDNGERVQSTVANNTADPNSDMTGWSNPKDTLIHTVATLSNLTDRNGKNGDVVYVLENKKRYLYDSSLSAASNGVTIIGKWEMEVQEAYYASWFAQSEVTLDQSDSLQSAWDYATLKKSNFVFDRIFYVSQKNHTYPDGLVRKIGLQVPNNSTTYFTANASIKLIPNAEPLGYVVNFYLAENFKIYNPVVYGDVDEHTGTTDESNHCFNIVNCKNGLVFRPRAYNAWGDGLYIGTEYSSATLKQIEDVTVFEPYAEHCGRDCISITSGKDVRIYSPTVKDAFRVAPKAGINIESEGIGLTKSEFTNVNILGTINAEDCEVALSIQLFESLTKDVSINVGDIVSKNCVTNLFAQLFSSNSGTVTVGDINATAWKSSVVRCNWSQLNCQLTVGGIHSINANCNGTVERFSSIIAIDIDAENQPLVNIGNFSIGDIYISDVAATKIMHPLYFKDNTTASDGTRKLDNAKIGAINGVTKVSALYADGQVTSRFKFIAAYSSAYYLPLSRPYLYSSIAVLVSSNDFNLVLSGSYKTALSILKLGTNGLPLKVTFPSGTSLLPISLAADSSIKTVANGSRIGVEWYDNTNALVNNIVGTWTPI